MNTEKDFSGFFQENKTLLKEYFELRFQLIKLQGVKILSRLMSLLIVIFIVGIFVLFVVLFLGLSFAWWLSDKSGSNVIGFAGAAGLFTILLIIVIVFRKPLFQSPLIRMFINESTKDSDEKE
jgi:predicted membrane protein